jgi:stress-induced morphogen
VRVYQFRHIRAERHCSPAGQRPWRRYDRRVSTQPLRDLLERAFPDATELDVIDRTGGGDHFQVVVSAPSLAGLSLVEQHRRVYQVLAEPLSDGTIHELRNKTKGTT